MDFCQNNNTGVIKILIRAAILILVWVICQAPSNSFKLTPRTASTQKKAITAVHQQKSTTRRGGTGGNKTIGSTHEGLEAFLGELYTPKLYYGFWKHLPITLDPPTPWWTTIARPENTTMTEKK